jgi:predicted amidohydrolase YtcJ
MNADIVIRGGRIFTAEPGALFVEAVATAGERIVAVGPEAESMIGPGTDVIELAGAMATPGFIDSHVHPATSGLDKLRCHFDDAHDAASAVETVVAYAAAHPDQPWITGAGWAPAWFPGGCPSKELLDAVVPDRPVLLPNTDGHGAWVNSKALEMAGLDAGTPDPQGGRIERLPDGSPQGTLHEWAVDLVMKVAPPDTVEEFAAGLLRGQEELLRHGVTGWQDANIGGNVHGAYLEVANAGKLIGRVVGAMWWDRLRGLEQIDDLVTGRERSAPRFSPTSVKLMVDGVVENYTASMLTSYLDADGSPTGNRGIDFIDPGTLAEAVTALDSLGFQCHFHAIGDRGVRNSLDAIEAALRANGPNDNRHHIAHIQVVHPDDLPRFAEVGAFANAQPLWACHDGHQTDLTIPFIGAERYGWQYPFASLLAAGARMGMGSDWGVSTCNVMEEIDVAVTRTGEEGGPLNAAEALDPVVALTAFTLGSAHINHSEADSGSISVGKLADLAVLDRDPWHEGPFRETTVVTTIVGGEVVYEVS